jgi:putative FmdB family regulatory protein
MTRSPNDMPTYEYVCTSCQNQWEEIQKISEAALEVCPKCHGSTAKRQISGGSFILKGGGWYADLYSSSGGKKKSEADGGGSDAKGDAKSDAKSETKGETKTETKTEAKAETKTETKPSAPTTKSE